MGFSSQLGGFASHMRSPYLESQELHVLAQTEQALDFCAALT
jgi:hypothetical protein